MQNRLQFPPQTRLVIRIGRSHLSFSAADSQSDYGVLFEPYALKGGMSMAANLRQALADGGLPFQGFCRVLAMTDSCVLLIPIEEFTEEQADVLYRHVYGMERSDVILHTVLPNQNAVAVFAVNGDLQTVLNDRFTDVRFMPLMQPVWSYLHKRSFTGMRRKLYVYVHDREADVFAFRQSRFIFCNRFDATAISDVAYYILNVWKQLGMDVNHDELHLVHTEAGNDELTEALKTYIHNTYLLNPSADFNRAPVTGIRNMPFDLQTLFAKGR
ncbi:MAG: DUF3822 family protein [Prevotella sp.]